MAITAKAKSTFTPAPEGVHQAVCVDVVDMGMVRSEKFNNESHKIRIVFQINEINPENGKRFLISSMMTLTLSEKSRLKPFLETWRGKKMTKEELDGFDVEKLVGANAMVQVLHSEGYANIVAIMPLTKGLEKISALNYVKQAPAPAPPKDEEMEYTGSPDIPVTDDDEENLPF